MFGFVPLFKLPPDFKKLITNFVLNIISTYFLLDSFFTLHTV